ncbi:plasmid recombination protein [Nostocaceae cyanobacterium CENA369]|uniref:Plasmid recombination protein n=1 Tax=Dendronalium phyllosphericum CENA369 TaxID=1725256 RepID=A0A8J7I4V5_9NOST|nr:MobV family relaxase [Dendronalium phyllosphericum]MBH8573560.1 plasmid recombination protein [Dendronalium phyllosphericum CENA369]
MAYAIARLKKLKRGNISGSASHTARERETPNANPTQKNIRFIGSLDPEERLEDLVLAKIAEHEQKRKIRTDAVYCVELLLSASPSYFRPDCPTQAGYYEPQKLDDWVEATHQWLADEYGSRIVRAELHLDEATPHIHAYFVPIDDEGQLRCNHFFDGRQKIHAFQDSYYDTMRLIGLERGIKGSKAQHQDIKDFYRIVEEGRDLEVDELSAAQLRAKAADRDRANQRKQEMEATAKALALENEQLRQRIEQLEQDNQSIKKFTEWSTDLALDDVAWELGLWRKGNDWVGRNHIINIDGFQFTDFGNGSSLGGNSAIDLVKHVNKCNQTAAIAWLGERFGKLGAQRAAIAHAQKVAAVIIQTEPVPQFTPPIEDKKQWQQVEHYLTQKQGIPSDCVQMLHNQGIVYADSKANAVFLMRNQKGKTQGAFLQGTINTFSGYELGTHRRSCWFYFTLGKKPTDKTSIAVLCQSPIDTISVAMLEYLDRGIPPKRTVFMTVDDSKALPVEQLQNVPHVSLAFTHTSMARAIKQLLPQSKLLKCETEDWNSQLVNFSRQLQQRSQQNNQELEL